MAESRAQQAAQHAALQDLSGTSVGRFAVKARLGVGAMGEVYRAEDTKLKRPVALKRIAPELRTDEHYRQRFLREAEYASRLSDPHIANVYDVFEQGADTFLVMEYVEGESLRQQLGRPMPVEDFLPIALQCATALAAAHERGILHRDIKPENIMLTPAGRVKILDFGIAKRLPRPDETASVESHTGGFSGTPAYMAPEVLLEKEADARSDIFSLGVVFYEALAGKHPFRAGSFVATSNRILEETPAPLPSLNPDVPAELDQVITKMLAKDPATRYASAAEVLADLRAIERTTQAERPWKHSPTFKERKYVRLLLGLFLVMVLALAAVALWRVLKPKPVAAQRIRVAVLPFLNQTGDQRLDRYRLALTQVLVLDLTDSPNIQILSYERLLEITQGFEAEGKDFSSPEAVKAVASYGNSQFVVVPAMFAIGKTLRVSAEFRDAQTGQTVGATNVERALSGSPDDTVYSMLRPLEDGIQAYFKNVGLRKTYQPRPEGSRPKTATAALHVNEGRYAFARGNYAQALHSFQQAIKEDAEFALPYAWSGQIYGLLGYDDKARQFSTQAAALIRSDTPVTEAYFIEANLDERKYDFSAAADKYLELIRLYPDDPEWHARLAGVYEKQGQYKEAIASYEEVLRRDPNYIVVYQRVGSLYSKTDNLPQALFHVQKALSLYRALGNREGEGNALLDLGEVFRLKADYQQAREYAQSALELFQTSGNEFGVLHATKTLGDILASEGDWKTARRYYQQVISESGEIRNNRLVTLALMNLGVLYSWEGNLAKAVEYYERSLAQGKLYGQYKDWPALRDRVLALTNLAGLYIEYGPDPKRALPLVQEALAINQKMGVTAGEARNRMHLGTYEMNAGQYQQAFEQLQEAQSLFRSVEYNQGLGQATFTLGRYYFIQNQYEQALRSFAQAFRLFQELQDGLRMALLQIHLGWTYTRLGNTAQARSLLEEGLQAAKKKGYGELLPDAYNALGELDRESGEKERARQGFQQASAFWIEPYVSEFSVEARSNLGVLEAERGNLEPALSYCRQSVERAHQLQRLHLQAQTVNNLARVYILRKEYDRAAEVLREMTSVGDTNLGLEFRAQAFYLHAEALRGLGRSKEAQAVYREGQDAIRKLQQRLAADHRESFATRRDIKPLLP